MKTEELPEYLIVAVAGKFKPCLAIRIKFGMRCHNDFSYIAFIYKSPITLTKTAQLERFDRIRNSLRTHYADPREAFDGEIEVEVLTSAEIKLAIKYYHDSASIVEFPPEYLANLETSLQVNSKSDCIVACEKVY